MTSKPRAVLIDIVDPDITPADAAIRLAEAKGLTDTYGGLIVVHELQRRSHPDPRTFVGSGKLDELAKLMVEHEAELLIVNGSPKPRQLYEIETKLRATVKRRFEVWDRVDLILKIFAKHARSTEAQLQITLASIGHMGPRIYRMGMDLSGQRGGTGTRGGQGETNTELMKRHLARFRDTVERKLDKQAAGREMQRNRRERDGRKTVSIVGYTNAGKTSLLNALTHKGAYAADQLFATLETSMAQLWLPTLGGEVSLSDTIGFIQDLPPGLIQAFRSTLEETAHADLLLHTIDAGDPRWRDKVRVVDEILAEIGAQDIPQLLVFNKADTVAPAQRKELEKMKTLVENERSREILLVSAKTGDGLQALKDRIATFFAKPA
jgi:GTP-binding protein HflX